MTSVFLTNIFFYFDEFHREEKGIAVDDPSTTSAGGMEAPPGTISTVRANAVNPLNMQPYSQRYHTLYRKRVTLPVFEYRADFMRLLAEHQCIVLVGK